MNRNLPTFKEAEDRVKISHFTRKGMDIRGIVHVGTNDWYEYQWYKKMGIEHIIGFEPLPEAVERARKAYPEAKLYQMALGNNNGKKTLLVASGDGQSSTMLEMTPEYKAAFPDIKIVKEVEVPMESFYGWYIHQYPISMEIKNFNCLVVDVEGMELEVLKGFDSLLNRFDMLNVECSGEPTYIGGPSAKEVVDFLMAAGFVQDSPIEAHNDIMFIKKNL